MKPIAATFESETEKGSGHIGSLTLGSLFLRTELLPETGECVAVRFADHNNRELEVFGTIRTTGSPDRRGFYVQLHEVTDAYLAFYDHVLTN